MDFAVKGFREFLQSAWPIWNSQIPPGHYACLKLYISYKAPLSLVQNASAFQLQYGEMAYPPFVHASNVAVGKWVVLSDHDDGSKMVCKAQLFPESRVKCNAICEFDRGKDNQLQLDISISNLTELDLSRCNIDFTHIIIACPQLQRLNLKGNTTLRLEDLQMIATCCCNLKGLNLMEIPMRDMRLYINVWEVLSSMKLTYLSIDNLNSSRMDDEQEKQLIALFKQCRTLQALEFHWLTIHSSYKLLSYFPSLKYLGVANNSVATSYLCARNPYWL